VGTHFAPADGRDGRPRAPTPADWNACAPPSAPSAAAVTAATAPHRMVRLDVSFVTSKLLGYNAEPVTNGGSPLLISCKAGEQFRHTAHGRGCAWGRGACMTVRRGSAVCGGPRSDRSMMPSSAHGGRP